MRKKLGKENSVLEIYLKEINKYPLLSSEEEKAIGKKILNGDRDAYNQLVTSNLRFVVKVAKRYENKRIPLEDLISEGNIGLMNAVEKFDVNRGYHFISYAVWWIRQRILKALYEQPHDVRIPLNKLYVLNKINKRINSEDYENKDMKDLAKELDMKESSINELLNISEEMVSIDKPIYEKDDSISVGDFIKDTRYKSQEELSIIDNLKTDLNEILNLAGTGRDIEIIEHRFGINGKPQLTLQEMGDKYYITKERVRQIEEKILKKLRAPKNKRKISSYMYE